jgi:hypothetical protein
MERGRSISVPTKCDSAEASSGLIRGGTRLLPDKRLSFSRDRAQELLKGRMIFHQIAHSFADHALPTAIIQSNQSVCQILERKVHVFAGCVHR